MLSKDVIKILKNKDVQNILDVFSFQLKDIAKFKIGINVAGDIYIHSKNIQMTVSKCNCKSE